VLIVSDSEAIRHILLGPINTNLEQRTPRFVMYMGAGGSAEAGVPTAPKICRELRSQLREAAGLLRHSTEEEFDPWDVSELDWGKPTCYMTCMKKAFSNAAERVEYFKTMLRGKSPAFSHHALALLMRYRYLKSTCLTTNFDKLIETAFMQQDLLECQAIRNDQEARYWVNAENRFHVIKLHGDYDTDNILNTASETIRTSDYLQDITLRLLDYSGLVVLGTAGNEKSVYTLFDELSQRKPVERFLRFGLYWGVYVGARKPKSITKPDIDKLVLERIRQGEVREDIHRMIEDANHNGRPFCYFPVWGAGNFMLDLAKATNDRAVVGTAAAYLDHDMHLRHVFSSVGLSDQVIDEHIGSLKKRQALLNASTIDRQVPEEVFLAEQPRSGFKVHVVYGDISSRSLLNVTGDNPGRVAVVSPEDTSISAGGGVAYKLLGKAGKLYLLNELAKLAPIKHGEVAVTSGGRLPVQYIFHAAAVEICEEDGKVAYRVSKSSVYSSMLAILEKAAALDVGALYVPLLGTGVAGLASELSLEGLLEAIRDWDASGKNSSSVSIVVYRDKDLERHLVGQCLDHILTPEFRVKQIN
jgi:O-acetyl-ADP-ribose deacetylase